MSSAALGSARNPLVADLEHIFSQTCGLWEDLRGAHLFVTGGTGFFGCWLLESFVWACDRLKLGADLTVLTRSPEAFQAKAPHLAFHPAIHMVRGDVVSLTIPPGRYSHVIHGATEASAKLSRERPLVMLDTIVQGTRWTLEYARRCGASRFLLISSGAVYGAQPPAILRIPEGLEGGPDSTNLQSVYGEGKRLAELTASLYARTYGLECPIARCFAFVGPHLPLDAHFAIGNFIGDCLEGRAIEIRGDGTPRRSYLYAADLAVWLWTILLRGKSGRAYNVGSEHDLSIAELAATVASAVQAPGEIQIAQEAVPGAASERYVPDTARARGELGLQQWVSLDEGIRRTAAWHKRVGVAAAKPMEARAC
jgi:nucleoside-diphosphate-sugar epimerase